MPADFEGIENRAENNRYYQACDEDGYIDFKSQASVFHFSNILKIIFFNLWVAFFQKFDLKVSMF
jgi:hypothetical protein